MVTGEYSMDITFNCDKCDQYIVIDETGVGQIVDCPKCNQSLTVPPASSQVPPAAKKKCPFCAEDIMATAVKCKHCGSMLAGSSQAISGVSTQPTSSPPDCSTEIQNPTVEISLWDPKRAEYLCLLFSPIFSSAILRANYKTLGMAKEAKRSTVCIGIGLTFLLLSLFLPGGHIFLLYFVVWYFMEYGRQGPLVKKVLNDRYTKKKWGKPELFWLCGVIGYVIVGMIINAIRGN